MAARDHHLGTDGGNEARDGCCQGPPPAPARFGSSLVDSTLAGGVAAHASAFAALSSWGIVDAGELFT